MDVISEKKSFGLGSNSLVQAWLVLLLAVGFGASLAGVQLALGPVIEQNKINETLEKVPELVLGRTLATKMAGDNEELEVRPRQVEVKKGGRSKFYSVYEARYLGKRQGWVVKTKGQGYADTIELLLGLSPDLSKITGLFVLEQKETPGLGNKIITEDWRGQFIDKPADGRLTVVKTGATKPEQIDGVTGATISSKSVTGLVNATVDDLRPALTHGEEKGGKNNG